MFTPVPRVAEGIAADAACLVTLGSVVVAVAPPLHLAAAAAVVSAVVTPLPRAPGVAPPSGGSPPSTVARAPPTWRCLPRTTAGAGDIRHALGLALLVGGASLERLVAAVSLLAVPWAAWKTIKPS